MPLEWQNDFDTGIETVYELDGDAADFLEIVHVSSVSKIHTPFFRHVAASSL